MSSPAERVFYTSAAWRKVRQIALDRDGGLCVECRRLGKVTIATEVDHIIPIKEKRELRLDVGNLQSLCHNCHNRKTARDLNPLPRFCLHGYIVGNCPECRRLH